MIVKKCKSKLPTITLIRLPVYSINDLFFLNDFLEDDLADCINAIMLKPFFRQSLIHSHSFIYDKYLKCSRLGRYPHKLAFSIIRLYIRMCSRSTPFGFCSTVSVLRLSETREADCFLTENKENPAPEMSFYSTENVRSGNIRIQENEQICIFCRPDVLNAVQCVEKLKRTENFLSSFAFFTNPGLYKIGDVYRYYQSNRAESHNVPEVLELNADPFLEALIKVCRNGISYEDICCFLISRGLEKPDCNSFLLDLLDKHILICQWEIGVDDYDFPQKILDRLPKDVVLSVSGLKSSGISAQKSIVNPDNIDDGHHFKTNAEHGVRITKDMHVDSFRRLDGSDFIMDHTDRLKVAYKSLWSIYSIPGLPDLEKLTEEFRGYYPNKAKALFSLLDPESGIPYGDSFQASYNDLVADFLDILPLVKENQSDDDSHPALYQLFKEIKVGSGESLSVYPFNPCFGFPDKAFYALALFSIYRHEQEEIVVLNGFSKPFHPGFLSRFTHLDDDIFRLAEGLIEFDKGIFSGKILAELDYLPPGHTGNVCFRKSWYPYRIPLLTGRRVNRRDLLPENLYVKMNNGRLILFDPKSGMEVVPRRSSAFNPKLADLPLVRFLCDYIERDNPGPGAFSWGKYLGQAEFFPRVYCDGLILSKAKYVLRRSEMHECFLFEDKPKVQIDFLQRYFMKKNIPDSFFIINGDRNLFINLKNRIACLLFLSEIKKRDMILIEEAPEMMWDSIVKKGEKSFVNQFVLPLIFE